MNAFDLDDGFPLLTTKKVHLKSIIHELLWFLKGETNVAYLKANGVDPKQVEIGSFQTMPMYDWKNPKRKDVGYRVTTQLTLKLVKDFSKLGPLTESLANIEAIENQNVSYTLDNMEAAKARAAAM